MIYKFFSLIFLTFSINAHELNLHMTLSPAGSFDAKTSKLRGDVIKKDNTYTSESLWVKIEDLKTENDLRNDHFWKHLGFDKNPKIVFNKITASNGAGTGQMTINNTTLPMNFTYKELGNKKLEANFTLKNSDFKLKEANYVLISVEDVITGKVILDVK